MGKAGGDKCKALLSGLRDRLRSSSRGLLPARSTGTAPGEGAAPAAPRAKRPRGLLNAFRRIAGEFRGRRRAPAEVAKITESNPDMVMKVGADGRILYANQSVERKLFEIGIPMQHAELLLPDDAGRIVQGVLGTRGRKVEMLWVAEGRTIRYAVFGLGNEQAVVFQGVDVTEPSAPLLPESGAEPGKPVR
jgi:hypothetical protein